MNSDKLNIYFKSGFLYTFFQTHNAITEEFLAAVVEHFILSNLDELQRQQFYKLIEKDYSTADVDSFLHNSIPNFDHKLDKSIKAELSLLMKL